MSLHLGIDTSNYTTSVALWNTQTGEMIQEKMPLPVPEGELGLRQSDAVFAHVSQLGTLIQKLVGRIGKLTSVGVSVQPRDAEGSYMPCFLVGKMLAESLSALLGIPYFSFSHQAGHVAAVLFATDRLDLAQKEFIAFHLSGGTTECLHVTHGTENPFAITVLSESLDLYAGQAVDRIGGTLGLAFPAGKELEVLAANSDQNYRTTPFFRGGNPSITGLESQCKQKFLRGEKKEDIAKYTFDWLTEMVRIMTNNARNEYPDCPVVYAGGVLSNKLIRTAIQAEFPSYFAESEYSSDNAAGTAVLAGMRYREGGNRRMLTLTISQLNRYVKAILEEDTKLTDLYLKAEISNFTNHVRSGHFYFTLKDEKASVKAIMFRGYAERIAFLPEEGMSVLARASVSLYEPQGTYQIYVTDLQPYGVGAMEIAFLQLRDALEKKGYFDPAHKKSLPRYPQVIGVITSKTGAAIGDITKVLSERYPLAKVLFAPALVQGSDAAPSLIDSLKRLDGKCDVIILGRGGGSKEDLWAFNDAVLAEEVFKAKTPIISAVGHEMDRTICDLVADHRAPTPSAAAEMATPDILEIADSLVLLKNRTQLAARKWLTGYRKQILQMKDISVLANPMKYIEKKKESLDFISKTMYNIRNQQIASWKSGIHHYAQLIESLSPIAVLTRGYAVVYKEKMPIKRRAELALKDLITVEFQDGTISAAVLSIDEEGNK